MASRKIVFWEVDAQVDFMLPGGALYVPGAEKIIPNLKRLVDAAQRTHTPLISSADAHPPDDPEFKRFNFPPHCVKGTRGADLIAEARAAIFDLVRAVNAAADAGSLFEQDAAAVLDVLADFDKIFAVLEDNDAHWTRFALEWAEREGRLHEASPEVLAQLALSDEQIDALIEERNQARRTRNFARADAIRKELLEKGILLEDSKDGGRWKRK